MPLRPIYTVGFILLPMCAVMCLTLGTLDISFMQLARWLTAAPATGNVQDELAQQIILQLRLPRIILAAIVGATLALCGVAAQGLFRNPLADPSLIGVTAGASGGGSLMILCLPLLPNSWTAGQWASQWIVSWVALGAFFGGLFTVFWVYHLARDRHSSSGLGQGASVATMLLVGIAVSSLVASVTHFFTLFSDSHLLKQISLWRMGSFQGATWPQVFIAALVFIGVFGVLSRQSSAMNALLLGETEARHLGLPIRRVKRRLIICMAIGVGTSVALAGAISFVGLIVPHMLRSVLGADHRLLIPASTFAGALLLMLADGLARAALAPEEIPIGLVTSVIGAPIFIILLKRGYSRTLV